MFAFEWEFNAKIFLTSFLPFCSCPVPLVAPANITGYNISSTSIHVAWQPISPDDTNIRGIHRGYRVYYTPINTHRPSVQMNATVDAHTTHAELNDLYKYTVYSIYVVVLTRWEGIKSTVIHILTDEGSRWFVFILVNKFNVRNTPFTFSFSPLFGKQFHWLVHEGEKP